MPENKVQSSTIENMPDQIPKWAHIFDDRYGITWRLLNFVKRIDLKKFARFSLAYLKNVSYKAPILIIGMPRSGTTTLFHILRGASEIGALEVEGHNVWRMYHHPRYANWKSDSVGEGQVRLGERRFVNSYYYANIASRRLLDKTADNCVRTKYLFDLFPDAIFVVIKRNPCDVINSYINGWLHPKGRFRSYYVPLELNIPGYPHDRRWCSTLIDGWENLINSPVPEIAFNQWSQYVNAISEAREYIPESQWIELYFEEIINGPESNISKLFERLGLNYDLPLKQNTQMILSNPANAMSTSEEDKWRKQNPEAILSLLPRIAPMAEKLGYLIDKDSGKCSIINK